MARDNKRDAVGCAGPRNSARRIRLAHFARQLAVAARLSARNLPQSLPNAQVEKLFRADRANFARLPALSQVRALAHTLQRRIHQLRKRWIAAQLSCWKLRAQAGLGFRCALPQATASRGRVRSRPRSLDRKVKVRSTSRSARLCRPARIVPASCPAARLHRRGLTNQSPLHRSRRSRASLFQRSAQPARAQATV